MQEPLDYVRPAPVHSVTGRFLTFVSVSGTIGFAGWCALDFFFLHVVLPRTERIVWVTLFFAFPGSVWFIARWLFKLQDRRTTFAATATFFACGITFLLIVMLGLAFHISIGGQL